MTCVSLDRVLEIYWPIGVPESKHVQCDRMRERTDRVNQLRPVQPRSGVAMDEHNALLRDPTSSTGERVLLTVTWSARAALSDIIGRGRVLSLPFGAFNECIST